MKKLLVFLLVLTMVATLLMSCAGDGDGEETSDFTETETESNTEIESESESQSDTEDESESETEAALVEYGLWIGDVRVTNRNQQDVYGDGTVVYVGDGEAGTLKLNGAKVDTIYGFEEEMEDSTGLCSKIKDLTLELTGANRIGGGTEAPMTGFSALDLTVTGDGSLSVSGKQVGLMTENAEILDGTVTAFALEHEGAGMNIGFAAFGNLLIHGGTVSGYATMPIKGMSYGVFAAETLEVNGGVLEAEHMGAREEGFPAISFETIAFEEGYFPLIRAGQSVALNSMIDDPAAYTYGDAYILIQ